MAEFSKQYCELNDMGFEGDFDIQATSITKISFNKLCLISYIQDYICKAMLLQSLNDYFQDRLSANW